MKPLMYDATLKEWKKNKFLEYGRFFNINDCRINKFIQLMERYKS